MDQLGISLDANLHARRIAILKGFSQKLGHCLIAVASLIAVYHFIRLGVLYADAGITSDAELYFAMGRGWLNGLTFYRDLFETKPPLAFLLPALSLWLTGGAGLYFWLQLALLFALAPLLAYRLGIVGFLLGITLAIEALHRSLGYQIEGFALLFAAIPSLVASSPFLLSVPIAIATMLKEPFLASSALALAIIEPKKWKAIVIVPFLCLCVLLLCGCLNEYFTIYLPEIFSGRTSDSLVLPNYATGDRFYVPVPLWVRSLNVYRLFMDVPMPIGVFLFLCVICWSVLRAQRTGKIAIALSGALVATAVVAMHTTFLLLSIRAGLMAMGRAMVWNDPSDFLHESIKTL